MMDRATDNEVVRTALGWLDDAAVVTLATVVSTWGSAPRRPGALMAMHPDGQVVGSVSGGCVEDDLVSRMHRGEFDHALPRIVEYGVSALDAQRVGLPCGGRLSLVVERIDSALPLRTLLAHMDARTPITRRVCLATGETSLHAALPTTAFSFDGHTVSKVFGPQWRLLIIGAGELARRVAQIALTLDYAVTICDPRPEYAHDWQVDGTRLLTCAPREAVRALAPDAHTAVLALSHTPKLDDAPLIAALDSAAFYIGALGSHASSKARRHRLHKHGVTRAQLARLHAPVGLAIGSRTPAEIAIAIMGGLIEARHVQTAALATGARAHG